MNKRKILVISITILILAGAFIFSAYLISLKKQPPNKPDSSQLRAVKADSVSYSDILTIVEASGRLGSQHYVDVISEVQGEILPGNVSLKKGESFKEGELLFRVFDKEAAYTLRASKSRFLNLIANALPDLQIDYPDAYQKWFDFFKKIDISEPLPDFPEIGSDQEKTFLAGRNILADYYTIKSSEVRLEKYQVHAPFNGSFTDVYLEVGSIANMGSRVARIIRTDKLELEVPVEVEDVKWISKDSEVEVFDEDRKISWRGTIARKAGFVDPTTQSISVFVYVYPTTQNPLYEGQYLTAVFKGRELKDVMAIPRNAVFNYDEVFIVRDSLLYKERINIRKINNESIIFNGIPDTVQVVTEPLVNIPEKSKVKVIND